jgi:catechol 2,3-dioxygenase-like lactoylglutathione lyase family enzyme
MKITGSNVTIMVKDMDKAIAFYQSLGLELKQRWDNHYAMLSAQDIVIGLHPGGDEKSSSGSLSIGFMIDDIEEVKALLKKEKIAFTLAGDTPDSSGIYANFKDLDGTHLYFVKPKWN